MKARAVHGVKWTGISTVVVTVTKYARTIILARLLVPRDFGLMAMVTVIVGLGQAFSDMGISLAIIWRQDASEEELSSVYWFNIFTGIVVTAAVAAAAPLVVRFYNEPRLHDLVLWMSPVFLITSIGVPFRMILQKELMFRRIALMEIVSTLVAAAAAVTAAVLQAGVYALVWGAIAEIVMLASLQTALGWKVWRPRAFFRASDLKRYLRFGLFNLGERILNFFQANVDYIILGRFLGGETLGIYMIAYQLVVEPLVKINPVLTRVAFPVFAKRQEEDDVLRRGYCELSRMVAFLTFPALALMAATAQVFIPALFGAKWTPAVSLVQILVILGALRALINPVGSMLYTKGRTDLGFYYNLVSATLSTLVFWAFVHRGMYVIAWLEDGLSFLYFLLVLAILKRVIGLGLRQYATAIVAPLGLNLCVGASVYAAYLSLRGVIPSGVALLAILLALGLSLYAAMVTWFERDLVREYWGLLRGTRDASGESEDAASS